MPNDTPSQAEPAAPPPDDCGNAMLLIGAELVAKDAAREEDSAVEVSSPVCHLRIDESHG